MITIIFKQIYLLIWASLINIEVKIKKPKTCKPYLMFGFKQKS